MLWADFHFKTKKRESPFVPWNHGVRVLWPLPATVLLRVKNASVLTTSPYTAFQMLCINTSGPASVPNTSTSSLKLETWQQLWTWEKAPPGLSVSVYLWQHHVCHDASYYDKCYLKLEKLPTFFWSLKPKSHGNVPLTSFSQRVLTFYTIYSGILYCTPYCIFTTVCNIQKGSVFSVTTSSVAVAACMNKRINNSNIHTQKKVWTGQPQMCCKHVCSQHWF